jgi:hypothetical protein
MASAQISGTAYITINGELKSTKDNSAKLSPGGFELESVFANNKRVGYKNKPVSSKLSFTLINMTGDDLTALRDIRNATVQFETETGDKYIISGCDVMAPPEFDGTEISCTMEGDPAVKA